MPVGCWILSFHPTCFCLPSLWVIEQCEDLYLSMDPSTNQQSRAHTAKRRRLDDPHGPWPATTSLPEPQVLWGPGSGIQHAQCLSAPELSSQTHDYPTLASSANHYPIIGQAQNLQQNEAVCDVGQDEQSLPNVVCFGRVRRKPYSKASMAAGCSICSIPS